MSVDTLLNEVNGLSEERLDEVITFVQFLKSIDNKKDKDKVSTNAYRNPGGLSGTFVMADDFDETPDCFKEYV